MNKLLGIIILLLSTNIYSAELSYQFNSPSFNGSGYSQHVLTINQLETQAAEKKKAAEDAQKAEQKAAAENTPQAKFLANLESRIYSQLAQQLTNSMFGEGAAPCTTPGAVCGTIPDLGGNTVSWSLGDGSDSGMIILHITNNSNPSQTTIIKVPSGTFYF
jgi:hypothetical protein